jgi:hypothetical protein
MNRALIPLLSPMLLILAGGCAETRTYSVAVRNESAAPITVGLAKVGGPFERHWAAPEEAALDRDRELETAWDSVVVAPGRTGYTGPVKGKFERNARATLRVYGGVRSLSSALAVSRGNPRRIDLVLTPGRNSLVVSERDGRLVADPVRGPLTDGPTPTAAGK